MKKIFIIAEAGVNHNGSMKLAKQLIDKAAEAKADAVKFQTFKCENVISRFAQKAEYQKQTTDADECQLEMVRKLQLSYKQFIELKKYCDDKNIMFFSAPFDLESVDFLAKLDVPLLKIPSGEITNLPYLKKVAALRKEIVLSTGMAEVEEIATALNILKGCKVTLLHCTTEYPCPFEDVNLRAIETLRKTFNLPVGYSDHTEGIEISLAAAALGASVIEKHFTLDKNLEGPDHKASLEPNELTMLVKGIRNIEKSLGDGIKKPAPSEIKNIAIARKSIVAAVAIKKGEIFTEENITVKRPGTGISPMKWFEIIGKHAKKDFGPDELIES